jgi:HK97 gp10 family phage protein
MAGGGVISTGMDEMRRAIDVLPSAVQAAGRRVAAQVANRTADVARQRVAVRTGDLKSTIAVTEDAERRQFRVSVGRLTGPPIALFLEHGTEHMDARPFFGPALQIAGQTYQRDLEAATEQAAKQAFG